MKSIMVINGKRLRNRALVVLVAFFTAVFIYTQTSTTSAVFKTEDGAKAVYSGQEGIALTFNIGWGDKQAIPIINKLVELNVTEATFFLSGSWAERHPDTVELLKKHGFEIGSLGYAYVDYTDISEEKVIRDIRKAQEVFEKLSIKDVTLLRTPTGHFDKKTVAISEKLGFDLIHWSVTSDDWKNPGAKTIVTNVESAQKGDIILLHASDAAKQTAIALPDVVETLKSKDKFVTVSTLMANGKVTTKVVP